MTVTHNVRLLSKLGEGGMGSVWVAEHEGLSTRVAVKFVATDLAKRYPMLRERFKREAGVAARIRCPHVVQVFDHGLMPDETPYIVMELLEGETLEARMQREGPLGLRFTAFVVSQVAQVLGRAHALGVVHRDIKPANIFLTRSDYEVFAKVLDFGIAKHTVQYGDLSVTSTGTMLGSPLYMSPEQFNSSKGVDARADLWSLSVVAYQALIGKPAFAGDTLGQVIMAAMSRKYTPPTRADANLPPPLDAWFAKAFAESVDERHKDADELARTFVAIANEVIITGFRVDYASVPKLELGSERPLAAKAAPAPDAETVAVAPEASSVPGTSGALASAPDRGTTPSAAARVPATDGVVGSAVSMDGRPRRRHAWLVAALLGAVAVLATLVVVLGTRSSRTSPSVAAGTEGTAGAAATRSGGVLVPAADAAGGGLQAPSADSAPSSPAEPAEEPTPTSEPTVASHAPSAGKVPAPRPSSGTATRGTSPSGTTSRPGNPNDKYYGF